MQVHLSSQVTRHLVETLDRIRYTVCHLETFTYDLVGRDPRKSELQTNSLSIPQLVREQKELATHAGSDRQSILPLATRQCCFRPLS